MNNLSQYYNERIEEFSSELAHIQNKINVISLLRLFAFVAGVALSIFIYRISPWLTAITVLLFTIAFLVLVRIFMKLKNHSNYLRNLIAVNKKELMCFSGEFLDFEDGLAYIQDDHPYAADLDIFGYGSIFQIINRTSSFQGKRKLADWLLSRADEHQIIPRQQAIAEVKNKTEWRHEFQANGMDLSESGQEFEEIRNWLEEDPFFLNNILYRSFIYILPSITIILLVLSFFFLPINFFFFLVLIQFGITGINLRKINRQHRVMTKKYHLFSTYSKLFMLIEEEQFVTEKLVSLKNELYSGNEKASKKIRLFARLIDNFDRRLNMIAGVFLNGLFLWDINCVIRLEAWRNLNRKNLLKWLQVIAEYDVLISFGGYWFNNPGFTLPVIKHGTFIFKSEQISHPLINTTERIYNDFALNGAGQMMLVTGSNMAGKSTFLRSIGVNMILGMAGAPVCAKYLEFTPVQIFTSMRIGDSIIQKESTFYAELKRLKHIIDHFEAGGKALVLLDEILKGTNSKDKHYGSEILIRQLIRYGANAVVATHDLDLCRLENDLPGQVNNFCFEVYIENGQFHYDYILRKGVCKTMNATELMKQMGISVERNK
ncbi:MAG: hypothetical protein AMS27_09165 [Bacteroides sp. SM23_62_1]|nr:MAG: hypothetical protein AMS27_09165 [Bacteroides sp. SM23_62_1]